jgi:hypothetical protein
MNLRTCPECGRESLEYFSNRRAWCCLWKDCNYRAKGPIFYKIIARDYGMLDVIEWDWYHEYHYRDDQYILGEIKFNTREEAEKVASNIHAFCEARVNFIEYQRRMFDQEGAHS